jgi:hypothetical protein
MTRYWIKIVAGALLIFAAGMAVWYMGKKGVSTAQSVFDSADPITIPIRFVDFRVDGAAVGKIQTLRLLRESRDQISSVEVTVRLDSAAIGERLRACAMRLNDLENLDEQTTFVCAPAGEPDSAAGAQGFEPFGVVKIEGTEVTMPLLLPEATVRDFRKHHGAWADSLTPPPVPDAPAGLAAEAAASAPAVSTSP